MVQGIQSKQNLILEPSKLFLLMSALRNLSRGRVLFNHEYCNFNRKRRVEPEPKRVATFKRFHFCQRECNYEVQIIVFEDSFHILINFIHIRYFKNILKI